MKDVLVKYMFGTLNTMWACTFWYQESNQNWVQTIIIGTIMFGVNVASIRITTVHDELKKEINSLRKEILRQYDQKIEKVDGSLYDDIINTFS